MKQNIFQLFIMLSILTAGILHLPPETAATSGRNILRIGLNMKAVKLDPHFANESGERVIAEMIFNRLIRYKPGNTNEFEPDLAENIPIPEIREGRQVWTFKLRKGVMFHSGPETDPYELTARDVVYSFEKSINLVKSTYAGDYSGMTVEQSADDDYTVRIILEKPMSATLFKTRLAAYPGGFIISSEAFESTEPEEFDMHPVGTGPFMVETFIPGEKVILKANKQYFRGRPSLRGVEVRFIPDISIRESRLINGKLDIIEGILESRWAEKMEQEHDIRFDPYGIGETAMIHFNTTAEPMKDRRVRRAIAYALDRGSFLERFGKRVARNIFTPVPGDLVGGLKKKKLERIKLDYPKNMEKAIQLMDEAGYPEGFPIELFTSEKPAYLKYYKSMKVQLLKIGIDCKLKIKSHSTMHTRIREDKNALVVYVAWRPDADAILTRFFHSDSIMVTGAKPDVNFSHYRKLDKLINAARTETDEKEQIKLWEYAQAMVLDDMVVYPVHYLNPGYARRNSVDYGYKFVTPIAICPQITEKTGFVSRQ